MGGNITEAVKFPYTENTQFLISNVDVVIHFLKIIMEMPFPNVICTL